MKVWLFKMKSSAFILPPSHFILALYMGGFDEKAFDGERDEDEHESAAGQGSARDVNASTSSSSLPPSSLPFAVCLVSGGMDSCVTAAIARGENEELALLHVSYGQRTEARELRAFAEIADYYSIKRRLAVSIEHLARIGGSSLTETALPVAAANLESKEIPTSYVPFRNAHLLAIAASWAEVIKATRIYIGAVAEDSSGYPDCRPEFYAAFEQAIEQGTRPETSIKIMTPIIHLRKSEIVRRGLELNAPLNLTWSCYQSSELACGRCDSCALRLRAFRETGVPDPILYA